jgi:hypothetical protein
MRCLLPQAPRRPDYGPILIGEGLELSVGAPGHQGSGTAECREVPGEAPGRAITKVVMASDRRPLPNCPRSPKVGADRLPEVTPALEE